MFNAVSIVAKDTIDATSTVVEHRYGEHAGEATKEGLSVLQDLGMTTLAVRQVGVGALVRRTAQRTGKFAEFLLWKIE